MLLQVVFHAQMAKEEGLFTFQDVVDGVAKKMVFRHPHVFGTVQAEDSDQALETWDAPETPGEAPAHRRRHAGCGGALSARPDPGRKIAGQGPQSGF